MAKDNKTPDDIKPETGPEDSPVTVDLQFDHTYCGKTYLHGSHEVDRDTANALLASEERVKAAKASASETQMATEVKARTGAAAMTALAAVDADEGSVDSA